MIYVFNLKFSQFNVYMIQVLARFLTYICRIQDLLLLLPAICSLNILQTV